MSLKLSALIFMLCWPCWAIQWEIVGQDSETPAYSGELSVDLTHSVWDITVQILQGQSIPYVGDSYIMRSILGTPTGDAAVVVESADRKRVYGWCYEVDGSGPPVLSNQFYFPSQSSTLRWYFAFSLYDHGEWTQCCVPAYTEPLSDKGV